MGPQRTSPPSPPHCTRAFLAVACAAFLPLGCANPGPPRPPSLHLPSPVADLAASRVGDTVQLTWTTPDRSTDDLPLAGPFAAEVCQATAVRARDPDPEDPTCQIVLRLSVQPGPSHASVPLPAMATAGPPALLALRLRLRNSRGRAAALSAPALSVAGVAPPPVTVLQAQPAPGGVTLRWTPIPGSDPVLLHRTLVSAAPARTPETARIPETARTPETTLAAATARRTDPGGALDRTAAEGLTYRYTAERVRTLVLDGQTLTLRSPLSAAATVLVRDIFPPAAPTGLASIPGAPGQTAPAIDLSWEPSPEPDLAGYRVYRSDAAPSAPIGSATPTAPAWTLLTPVLLTVPAFHDLKVTPGHAFLYRVTALDTAGNESPSSTPVSETPASP